MIHEFKNQTLFNGPLETGIRSLCILVEDINEQYDLQQLIAFDHLVVHTGDINNAPPSLHPSFKNRNGELLIRRPLVERGLLLMESRKLIYRTYSQNGFYYNATNLAESFLNSLTNKYVFDLRNRAKWVVCNYKSFGDDFFSGVFNNAFDRWAKEFEFIEISIK